MEKPKILDSRVNSSMTKTFKNRGKVNLKWTIPLNVFGGNWKEEAQDSSRKKLPLAVSLANTMHGRYGAGACLKRAWFH